ncbi:hypothetical protein [Natrialba swarupiae]|uniref:WD40 repeat domain-containing protein n=1 Tax=Natrialba swarupiae TaxID=2448032 RepID=A0A5D5AJX4_9EURY|nr:hypothetical protein [Natrialba swarupiae]TYT61986.1 hypothetical protein FYC77_10965 [Natrialba swarupiae]
MRLRRNGDPDPPGLEWEARKPWKAQNELTDRQTIEYDEETYFCRTRDSSDGTWRVAYGSPISGGGSRAFLFSNGELRWSVWTDHPIAGFVSERGTVVILGGGAADDLDGGVRAFDASGTSTLEASYEANVADGDLSADGSFAVVQTHPPDNRTYLYDLTDGGLIVDHASDWGQPAVARIGSDGDTRYVYLSESREKRPLYALDESGSVAWESERHRKRRPLIDRIRTRLRSA